MTFFLSLFAALLATSHAAAIASSKGPSYAAKTYNATFDDRVTLPAEPLLGAVGAYDGLYYSTYVVTSPGVLGVNGAGVNPASPPNFATTGVFSQAGTTPYLSSTYTGSKVSYFTLYEFYMGCVLNIGSQSAASLPTACTLRATGYLDGKKTGSQDFTFLPSNDVVAPLQKFDFNILQFGKVNNVTMQLLVATGGVAMTAVAIDNVIYTTYNKTS